MTCLETLEPRTGDTFKARDCCCIKLATVTACLWFAAACSTASESSTPASLEAESANSQTAPITPNQEPQASEPEPELQASEPESESETQAIEPESGPAVEQEPGLRADNDQTSSEQIPAEQPPAFSGRGLIATTGQTGLTLLAPDGRNMGQLGSGYIVTQPTWSRDGSKLVATLISPDTGAAQVAVMDIASREVTTSDARRSYFFYSWNHDTTRLVALGTGASGGTAMDILDGTGAPTSPDTFTSSSVFVAWEPDGQRLLVHAGPQLRLFDDPDQLDDYTELGTVGTGFQAAAWVPGQNAFLYVDDDAADNASESSDDTAISATAQLRIRNLDDDSVSNLGPAPGLTAMTVHPDGDRVALAFASRPAQPSDPAATASADTSRLAVSARAAVVAAQSSLRGSVEVLNLISGERTAALAGPGLWVDWSPDGQRLLMATTTPRGAADLMAWHVWDSNESFELAQFTPSLTFLRNYLPFSDQYDETQRLWSPDSDAITYSAVRAGEGDFAAISRLDRAGDVVSLGLGTVSFWSPLP